MKKEALVLGISLLFGFGYAKECKYYEVKKGDTLSSIARREGVSIEDILSHNKNLKPDKLIAGEKICIPVAKTKNTTKAQVKESPKKVMEYDIYTVQKGARLKDIANKLGVPLKELEELNPEYRGKFLAKGTKVKVPKREVARESHTKTKEYDIYTVQRGARLKDVAQRLGVSLKELEELNPEYKGRFLTKGTKVKVPKGVLAKESKGYVKHKVKRGETLASIARRYGVSQEEIIKVNGLKGGKVFAGQVIKIPVSKVAEREKEEVRRIEKYTSPEGKTPEVREEKVEPTKVSIPKGSIPMPVDGKVVKASRGVDIITDCGKDIRSVEDGKVLYSGGDLQAYGNMVIIEHDSFISLYAYNSKNLVKRGDTVSKGQKIAEVGSKSNSGECMLHFELRTKDGVPLDPTEYLSGSPQ